MAQPSGGGDGRLPRDRPGNSATLVATWRRVCVNYAVNSDAAETLVAEITTAGGRAIAVAADVADSAAVEAMVAPAMGWALSAACISAPPGPR